jgi:hypothetical protein
MSRTQDDVERVEETAPVAEKPAELAAPSDQAGANRRASPRAPGPFDGRRVGVLETPIKIFDLSVGGCFILSMHEQQPGVAMSLRIDLPDQRTISVKAQSLYSREEFGFAVLFVDVDAGTRAKLEEAVQTALSPG